MTYYQWDNGSVVRTDCGEAGVTVSGRHFVARLVCYNTCTQHDVLWAWDRSLGAWVHYRREALPYVAA